MSRRPSTPPAAAEPEESLSPLSANSFALAPGDRTTSNTRFGAIGGPSPTNASFAAPAPDAATPTPTPTATTGPEPGFVLPQPHAHVGAAFRHVRTLEDITPSSNTTTQRTLRSNQPGNSYVTSLPTWRRGPEQPVQRPVERPVERPAERPVQRPVERAIPFGSRPAPFGSRVAPFGSRAAPFGSRAAPAPAPRAENAGSSRPVVPRDAAAVESRAGVGRGDFDGNAMAYRGLNARAPVFRARGMQPQQRQQQQQQPQRPRGGFSGLSLHHPQNPFQPMNMKLDPEAANRPLSEEEKRYRDEHGISHHYKGDPFNPSNESANIPDEENCAVWITLLPPDCTYKDLLSAVALHRPGKVWSCVISPPKVPKTYAEAKMPSCRTCAAKIVFYKAAAAQHLIHVSDQGQFRVSSRRSEARPAKVILNKIKVAPQDDTLLFTSRVLWITGPPHIVNVRSLTELFDRYFHWDTEEILFRVEPPRDENDRVLRHTLEWRFASYYCQAGSAFSTINSFRTQATPRFVPDPCAQVLTGAGFAPLPQ